MSIHRDKIEQLATEVPIIHVHLKQYAIYAREHPSFGYGHEPIREPGTSYEAALERMVIALAAESQERLDQLISLINLQPVPPILVSKESDSET